MATIKEVSRYANVSPSTVSRVINGTAAVNAETKERVLEAITKLNYEPNAFARGLATNRSGGIGVIVNQITSAYYGGFVEGIETVVQEHNMHLIVSSGYADALKERQAVEYLKQRRADALIIHLEEISDYELLEWFEQDDFKDIPVILLGRYVAELQDRCIYLDNEKGGYLATRHLIDCGHEKIAHISGPLRMKDSRDRLQGYRRALEASGLSFDEDYVVEGQFSAQSGQAAIKRLLDRNLNITAAFIANDLMAAGALRTLREEGINVPDDFSIVGYDDIFLSQYLFPELTTIQQPVTDMGSAAAKLALSLLFERSLTEEKNYFEPQLIRRQSVQIRPAQ